MALGSRVAVIIMALGHHVKSTSIRVPDTEDTTDDLMNFSSFFF